MCCDRLATIITILLILSVKEIHVPNHLWRLVFTSFAWTEQTFLLLLLFFLHLFIIIFKCSCLCLLFSSCFSFIMFFVVLLMKHLCSGGKVKKYIYSTTFI